MRDKLTKVFSNRWLQLFVIIISIGFCVWVIQRAGSFGLSRLFSKYAVAMKSLAAAQKATQLTPMDPQAYRASAALLSTFDSPAAAVTQLEHGVALRPADYSQWFALGLLRDQMGDSSGALAAFDEAVKRAPFYAHPRWQRGNLLLRAGQYASGFQDLNFATQSNPELLPNLIDLSWNLSKGDPTMTEQLAQISSPNRRVAFARFLARKGKGGEAVAQLLASGEVAADVRRELVTLLLEKDSFTEAFGLWNVANAAAGTIYDGGFEGSLTLNEIAFGWRVFSGLNTVALSSDSRSVHTGSKSLRIDFGGESPTETALVSQLVVVEPSRRYRLSFAARSEDVVTGAPPLAVVTDASGEKHRLATSAPVTRRSNEWQVHALEFTAGSKTSAVLITVRREVCPSSPCPIFGSIWLDSFSLSRLN